MFLQYACRKTLADSRPRVRGRFAKNDDFGEVSRPSTSNHDYDDDEKVSFQVLLYIFIFSWSFQLSFNL
ncbi:ribonuclease P/MRP protein subunit RPP1 [Apostasia shenzhenica]|uniref:Ribonuclease P/MRP protein subunit RPP1 n=1 Tax=Apostasia shenzhenica TaxID=1088818 RepID=A0A2I0AV48_9ASPA|nr:ribonuclease P/MRP protein subunit RPP1 [Apostasia shenzhenica]